MPSSSIFLTRRRFGITRRRLGEMLLGLDLLLRRRVAFAEARQAAAILVLRVVAAFLVEGEEAGEEHDLAGGAQGMPAGGVGQLGGGALQPRGGHLAGQRALPDQLVEPGMIARAGAVAAEIGRADRLVRFLRVLRLGLVMARLVRDVAGVVAVGDRLARGRDRLRRHLDAVGPHVGDRAVLVEALRDPHRLAGGEAELARRLLLQGRGGEGRRRVAGERLGLDRDDARSGPPPPPSSRPARCPRRRSSADRSSRHCSGPGGRANSVPSASSVAVTRPIFLGAEQLDLALAIDDQAQRHRLDAAGRFRAGQLAPQHRREGEADEIIERAAGAVGVDQILVELRADGPSPRSPRSL